MAASRLSRLAPPAKAGLTVAVLALFGAGYYIMFHSDLESQLVASQRQKERSQILPATTEYPQFLSAVQSAANDSGVSLSAWTPRERVPDKYYARVPMKVELTGRFHQIARFFHNVGQLDRIINMEDISMTDPKKVDDEMVLRAEALATAFHVVEGSAQGDDAKGKSRKARKAR